MRAPRPTKVMLLANTAWNLVNFRQNLIRTLIAGGAEVSVAAPHGDALTELAALGCRTLPTPMDNKGTSPFRDLGLLVRLIRLLRAERPDLLLTYTIKPNIYGAVAARFCRIPTLSTVTGLGTAFLGDPHLNRIVKPLYRIALRHPHKVFFQNGDDLALFLTARLVPAQKVVLVPGSGVDLEHFRPRPRPQPRPSLTREPPPTTFLFIGRLLRDKGICEFVDAARCVRASHPHARFEVLGFLGSENRTALTEADVNSWAQEGVITYLGTRKDVRPAIARADAVVLPSYREGTPRALLEAAAMAKPLIATDVAGCREPVESGENGFLCAARDANNLAHAMTRFLALDHATREAMGRKSRQIAAERFDEKIVIDATLGAASAALDHHRQAHSRRGKASQASMAHAPSARQAGRTLTAPPAKR